MANRQLNVPCIDGVIREVSELLRSTSSPNGEDAMQ